MRNEKDEIFEDEKRLGILVVGAGDTTLGRLSSFQARPSPPVVLVSNLDLPPKDLLIPGRISGELSIKKLILYGIPPRFSGNAKQRRVKRRAWLRAREKETL